MPKPKSVIATCMVEQRRAQNRRAEDFARKLDAAGSTMRSWESGRRISGDNLWRRERLIGIETAKVEYEEGGVAAAIRARTPAIEQDTALVERLVERSSRSAMGVRAFGDGCGAEFTRWPARGDR